jgi:hypothetical protein
MVAAGVVADSTAVVADIGNSPELDQKEAAAGIHLCSRFFHFK